MTEREVCERLVMDGHCAGVECGDCPLGVGEWDCTGLDVVTLAEMWLRLHPCEKKRVFSAEKFYADKEIPDVLKQRSALDGWPEKFDGKTEEECNALGCGICPEWMEEKEMGYKEKQADWLKANNLEEGSRVYVYRKPENYEDGWGYGWIDVLMDEMVGKIADIEEICPSSLKVKVGDTVSYMPYTALLPVGVTEFEVGRRYKYVGPDGERVFKRLGIDDNNAKVLGRGCELMVEEFYDRGVKFTAFDREWYFSTTWEDFVALPEKDYYKELGDWLMRNNLKAGDKVRILRSPTLEDMEGWECDWDDGLDKYVGQVGIVDFYYGDNDMLATFPDGEEVFVPYTVLEKVQRRAHVDLYNALEGVGIATISVELEDNLITIKGVIR